MTDTSTIASTIADQLGNGYGCLRMMIGVKTFLVLPEDYTGGLGATLECAGANRGGLRFRFMRSNRINMVQVVLDGRDTYEVHFADVRGLKVTSRAVYREVYADQLSELFRTVTGLEVIAPRWVMA